jgi:fluoride exporter
MTATAPSRRAKSAAQNQPGLFDAMRLILFAAAGGALGAGARHLVNTSMLAWLGPGFPWATFIVNVVGSLLMGILVQLLMPLDGGTPALRTFLATGVLGGFTTFSAFSLDAWVLYERQQHVALGAYVVLSVVLSIAALVLGMALVRSVLR